MSAGTAIAREEAPGVEGVTEASPGAVQAAGRGARAGYLDHLRTRIDAGTYAVDSIRVADSMLRVVGCSV
ncbi:MAG: flagellar biosynthesis anti-sigma factor FlgM [Acidimicrobiia bacterium]|nr:flagellar biosynthesis anti-sigma factor FlgM [Acidimicrobiia bacterium]